MIDVPVDTLPDGRGLVHVPSSPIVTVGQLHIRPRAHIKETDLSMPDTIGCISHMGFEMRKLYQNMPDQAKPAQSE